MTSFVDYLGIGINRYPDWYSSGQNVDLDYSSSDCLLVADALARTGLVRTAWVATDASRKLRPVRNEIYRGIQNFLGKAERDRPKIFYFAGHGVSLGGGLHICAADFDEAIAEKCGIDVSEIVSAFCKTSPWSVFIFDCCRAPLLASKAENYSPPHAGGGVRVLDNSIIMFACSQGEHAYEAASVDGRSSGGIFTHFIVKGLLEAFGKRGRIQVSIADLFNQARDLTIEYVLSRSERPQNPRMVGAQGTDFFLVRG